MKCERCDRQVPATLRLVTTVCCAVCARSNGEEHSVGCAIRQVTMDAPGARCVKIEPATRKPTMKQKRALKTTRRERIRRMLEDHRYQSLSGHGMRGLMPHHIDALLPAIERLVGREVRYAKHGGRDA